MEFIIYNNINGYLVGEYDDDNNLLYQFTTIDGTDIEESKRPMWENALQLYKKNTQMTEKDVIIQKIQKIRKIKDDLSNKKLDTIIGNATKDLIQSVTNYVTYLNDLVDITKYITEINEYIEEMKSKVEYEPYVKQLELENKLIKLELEKKMLILEKKLVDTKIQLLDIIRHQKGGAAVQAMYATIISTIIVLSDIVKFILKSIKTLLSLLPSAFSIGGESMTFFMTPKSITSSGIAILNDHKSIGDKYSEPIIKAVDDLLKKPENANIQYKIAKISASILKAQQTLGLGGSDINMDDINTPSLSTFIYKSIDDIISLFPFADPLPKYEKLNITNIGFMLWLSTGWCRAGQCAFGLPGYLPGTQATPQETTEI